MVFKVKGVNGGWRKVLPNFYIHQLSGGVGHDSDWQLSTSEYTTTFVTSFFNADPDT